MGTADVRSEAAALFALTWPTYIALLCEVGMSTVAAVFLGRTGSPATLGGAYLGISLANVLASAPIMGVATAQGTLSAQANGAGRPHLVGLYLQRGLAVNLGISLLVLPLLWWPKPLLWFLVGGHAADGTAAGGQAHVVAVATSFLRAYSPVLLPLSAYDALRRYLLAQDIATPLLWSSAAGLVANVGLHALLVSGAGLGILGSAVALVVAQVVNVAVLVTIILSGRLHTRTWGGWAPARAASNLRPYLALGLPGLVQVCAEWWAMEGTLFLVARYGAVPLAAHAALMNVSFLAYLAPLAVGTAASTRVGAALGRGAAAAARRAAWVAVAAGASSGVASCSVIWGARAWWPRLYVGGEAEEGSILAALAVVLPVFAVFGLSDTLQAVLGGVLRGSGRQSLGAYGNAAAFWVVGLPAGGVLAARAWAAGGGPGGVLRGMWSGVAASEWLLVLGVGGLLLATDWEAQVRRAEAFVRGGEAGVSPTSSLLGAVAGCGSPEEPPTPAPAYSPLLGVAVPGSRNEGAVWAPEEMPPLTMPAQSAPVSYGT